jgi:hypothetical protein
MGEDLVEIALPFPLLRGVLILIGEESLLAISSKAVCWGGVGATGVGGKTLLWDSFQWSSGKSALLAQMVRVLLHESDPSAMLVAARFLPNARGASDCLGPDWSSSASLKPPMDGPGSFSMVNWSPECGIGEFSLPLSSYCQPCLYFWPAMTLAYVLTNLEGIWAASCKQFDWCRTVMVEMSSGSLTSWVPSLSLATNGQESVGEFSWCQSWGVIAQEWLI